LRALDGRLAHASYRVIAQGLFGRAGLPAGAAWKTHDLRDRTIRLARSGWKLMHGGYLDLLRSPQPRHRAPAPSDRAQARRSPAASVAVPLEAARQSAKARRPLIVGSTRRSV
jgi:hypothetical protein